MASTFTPQPSGAPILFDICRGLVPAQKMRTEVWTVAGVDGYGAQTIGKADSAFELTTVRYIYDNDDNITIADEAIAAICGFQGSMVSIDDDWGVTWDNILLMEVDVTDGKKPCIYQGDETAIRIEVKWKCLNLDS